MPRSSSKKRLEREAKRDAMRAVWRQDWSTGWHEGAVFDAQCHFLHDAMGFSTTSVPLTVTAAAVAQADCDNDLASALLSGAQSMVAPVTSTASAEEEQQCFLPNDVLAELLRSFVPVSSFLALTRSSKCFREPVRMALAELSTVRLYDLGGEREEMSSLEMLKHCSQLHTIQLCGFQTRFLWCLGMRPQFTTGLVSLDLSRCSGLDDMSLCAILEPAQSLNKLNVAETYVSDHCMPRIAALPNLAELNLREARQISESGIMQLLVDEDGCTRETKLRKLVVTGCDFTDTLFRLDWGRLEELTAANGSPNAMGSNTALLLDRGPRQISLAGSRNLVSVLTPGAGAFAASWLLLLNLSGCKNLKEVRVVVPSLESLRCCQCKSLEIFQLNCTPSKLRLLDMRECRQLSPVSAAALSEVVAACTALDYIPP